jgi:hypothetical protein
VLLLIVLFLNGIVTWLTNRGGSDEKRSLAYRLLGFEWLPWIR